MKNKIYGYFQGNIGDDLMLQELLKYLNEDENEVILGKKNYLFEEFNYVTKKNFNSLFNEEYDNFIFLGGSTIARITKKNYIIMPLVHLKMIVTLWRNKRNNVTNIYWNTNLYSGKVYEWILRLYLKNLDLMFVRDQKSIEILERNNFKKYYLIKDLVEEINFSEYKTVEENCVGVSIAESQSEIYIKEKIKKVSKEINDSEIKIKYIEFQDKKNSKLIINELKKYFKNVEYIKYSTIDNSLMEFSKCKKIYCDRFHSMIIGKGFDKELKIDSYDEKTSNYLGTKNKKLSNSVLREIIKNV